ncbi:MAG: hypothetical protein EKK46_01425 [Rhodocyclaceae bacterium]|nr:MAG: hypothetical protein EKK46_01425 [Rhodocyclaceae bacterium]
MKRAVFLVLLAIGILWRLPADLVGAGLQRLSVGQVRLGAAEGTVWSGRGRLDVLDPVAQTWRLWRDIDWSFWPEGLLRARLTWQAHLGVAEASRLEVGLAGWRGAPLNIGGSVREMALVISSDLAKLGWQGDFSVNGVDFACDWQRACGGNLTVRWTGAGCDVLPGATFGDYEATVLGDGGGLAISWHTLRGNVRIEGKGLWVPGGQVHFTGVVDGDPALLQRLPAVAGNSIRFVADHWAVSF